MSSSIRKLAIRKAELSGRTAKKGPGGKRKAPRVSAGKANTNNNLTLELVNRMLRG